MSKNAKTPSFALPLILAFLGFLFLSSAIVLAPRLAAALSVQVPVAVTQPCAPCPPPATAPAMVPGVAASQPVATTPGSPEAKVDAPTPGLPGDAVAEPTPNEPAPAVGPASKKGPWVLRPDAANDYKLDAEGEAIIALLADMMAGDRSVTLKLTGTNNTRKSRKKAKYAAAVIKERIGKRAKVSRKRLNAEGVQDSKMVGLEVKIELTGGGK